MRQRLYTFLTVGALIILGVTVFWNASRNNPSSKSSDASKQAQTSKMPQKNPSGTNSSVEEPKRGADTSIAPLDRPSQRITKKKFGTFVTPQNSPVEGERFSGYHTGVDYEVFPDELDKEVPVRAICDGKLLSKQTASGYGGVIVQSCTLGSEPVTVVYGHLDSTTVSQNTGVEIKVRDRIGELGDNKSVETDGERKHLHLSIHKGPQINIRGYVSSQAELKDWVDPCLHFCQ